MSSSSDTSNANSDKGDIIDEGSDAELEYEDRQNFKNKYQYLKFRDKKQQLICSDVIFQMMNEALNRLEPVVYGFAREADCLINLVEMFSSGERSGVLKRAYIAKEISQSTYKEILDKKKFLSNCKDFGKRGLMRFQGVSKVRFLKSKAEEMD